MFDLTRSYLPTVTCVNNILWYIPIYLRASYILHPCKVPMYMVYKYLCTPFHDPTDSARLPAYGATRHTQGVIVYTNMKFL